MQTCSTSAAISFRRFAFFSTALLVIVGGFSSLPADEFIRTKSPGIGNPRRTYPVEVVDRVKNCVVNIHSERTVADAREWDRRPDVTAAQHRVNGMGTGIVVDPRGYLITNYHVVDDVHLLRVRLADGTNLPARVFARDPESDLAIIKVDPLKPLPVMPLGTSSDLMLAEPVIAIGNAYGYEHTVTTGIVSALKRDVTLNKEVSYKSLIQTSAGINPGNSGGPLINVHGEVIGVNVAIRANAQNIAFALPIDNVLKTCAEMISAKKRTGMSHGLTVRDMVDSSDNPTKRWVVVERVDAGSVAENRGIKPGDVLEKLNDQAIKTSLDVERAFLDRRADESVSAVVRRGLEEVRTEVALKGVDRTVPAVTVANSAAADVIWKKLGIRVAPVKPDQVTRVNKDLRGGLSVTDVRADGPAAKSGFIRGDVLIGLHQWETITPDNASFVLGHPDIATFSPIRFFLIRNGELKRGWLPNLE